VDSVEIIPGGTKMHLNKVVKDVPDNPEIVLRNQPQFLLSWVNAIQNGVYLFNLPDAFQFFSLTNAGESWLFGTENNLTATVNSISYDEVFGIMDSVKYISLSDGSEIILSKSFGFLQFPDFENDGNFNLVGIQDTEYGESIPGFWEFFDFEVGDVFQRLDDTGDPMGSGYITTKYNILNKQVLANSYVYSVFYIWYAVSSSGGTGNSSSDVYEIEYMNDVSQPFDHFPNQIYMLENTNSGYGTWRAFSRAYLSRDSVTNIEYKSFGARECSGNPYSKDVFYEMDFNSDTLYRYYGISLLGNPGGTKGIGFGTTLGETYKLQGAFEYWSDKELVGYVKDGDTVGTITPDSILLGVSDFERKMAKNQFLVFPNPAFNKLNIRALNNLYVFPVILEINNLQGKLVESLEIENNDDPCDISKIIPGIYFYQIKSNDGLIQTGKLIIK